jgi:hypothetical protein
MREDSQAHPQDVPQTSGPSLFGGQVPIEVALNELRLRLLDLTGRNRLVNFRHTPGRSLQLVQGSIEATFRRLCADPPGRVTITPLPEPDRADCTLDNGRLLKPEPKVQAARLGLDTSFELRPLGRHALEAPGSGSRVHALFYAEDLGRHCRKLEREARLAIEETGANMLYLVMGFLDFPEAPGSQTLYRAPLLCVPVALSQTQDGLYASFHLGSTGEDLADNLSLREKVKRDFGLNLPEYDADSDAPVEAYLDEVAQAVSVLPGWQVRRMMTLTLLSFSNMLLVRDLDPQRWPQVGGVSSLLAHPLVRQVFEGRPATGEPVAAPEYAIDEHPRGPLPLIYDADSSQHSALIDVLEGHNRVIEGPPGTGKSQTITNLVAAALQAGKSVLFVSEKLAALQVVKSRLTQAGLDPFVLELHSNKTDRKRILEDLAARIALPATPPGELPVLLERQELKRQELKAHAELMNARLAGPMGLTLHQVMWRSERYRMRCAGSAEVVQHLAVPGALHSTPGEFAARRDQLGYLAGQFGPVGHYGPAHPLWGFFPAGFRPEDDVPLRQTLQSFAHRLAAFADGAADLAALLGTSRLGLTAAHAGGLLSALAALAPVQRDALGEVEAIDCSLLPVLFPASDPQGVQSLAVLQDLQARQQHLVQAQARCQRDLQGALVPSAPAGAAARASLQALLALGLAGHDPARLQATLAMLHQGLESAGEALAQLQAVAGVMGLPFDGEHAQVRLLQTLGACLADAPMAVMHLRHEGLRSPGAAAVLQQAWQTLQQLQAQQVRLAARLHTDLLPSEEELKQAILTLREGDAWYRVLQGPWRRAVKLHQRLARTPAVLSPAERLAELELLLRHQSALSAWRADTALHRAAGEHFRGEQTPLEGLVACAQWVEASTDALDAVQGAAQALDPLGIERAQLNRFIGQAPVIGAAVRTLAQFHESLRTALGDAQPRLLKALEAPGWPDRLQAVQGVLAQGEAALQLLAGTVRPQVRVQDGLEALAACHEAPALAHELMAHAPGRALLGARFEGAQTRLAPVLAAHAHGRRLLQAGLPARVTQVLMAADGAAGHARLGAGLTALLQGWQDAQAFAAAMAQHGRFEPALWADPAQACALQYAQTLAARTQAAVQQLDGLLPWAQYVGARQGVVEQGLEAFVLLLEAGRVAPAQLQDAFAYRFYACLAQGAFDTCAPLRQFSGRRHTALREEFAALDRAIIALRGQQVAQDCLRHSEPPPGKHGVRVDDKTEMKLLEHLIPQQRPRVPVRRMLQRAGQAIQALKPCFMMGPQAVAQFLEPGLLHFDLVVMDEASQLRPEQAIGVIARGTQLVVVGDPKQLPPTSFFARMAPPEGDGDSAGQMAIADAESILDVCLSHFQPVRTLRWHYRSRHQSLIAFSNHYFYRGKLVVFPSPHAASATLGLHYHPVADGVYENQMNLVEARCVVDAAVAHILQRPQDSLGIVTLNIRQRDLLAEMLEERLRHLAPAADFNARWDAQGLGLFVKNLENVQGDERDCILISTTFGKPPGAGVVRQNFGPISRQGGWRRLNVLFTRARKSVAVFSSMRPQDILVDGDTPEGTRALRNYLAYADTGVLPLERETGLPPDSDFEIAVMEVLQSHGYEVTPQLGVAGFRIDIAVRHPGHRSGYLAAIECDGASYHSGLSVRDRDRIRQEVLESLGWRNRIWRIWSTDWFRNPLAETGRLLQFLQALRSQPLPEQAPPEALPQTLPEAGDPARSPGDDALASHWVLEAEDAEEGEPAASLPLAAPD